MHVSWEMLARLVARAATERTMFRWQRDAFMTVAQQLREMPLAGRRCKGCDGPLMQRAFTANGVSSNAVTFEYSCQCDGGRTLNASDGWTEVALKPYELRGGLELEPEPAPECTCGWLNGQSVYNPNCPRHGRAITEPGP